MVAEQRSYFLQKNIQIWLCKAGKGNFRSSMTDENGSINHFQLYLVECIAFSYANPVNGKETLKLHCQLIYQPKSHLSLNKKSHHKAAQVPVHLSAPGGKFSISGCFLFAPWPLFPNEKENVEDFGRFAEALVWKSAAGDANVVASLQG